MDILKDSKFFCIHHLHLVTACILIKADPDPWYSTVEKFEKIWTKIKEKNKEITIFWYGEDRQALDELSDQGYTSLPKSDEIKSGQMVLK